MENDRMLIDKLRQEMLSGKITYDDIVKRLTIAIETEYLKESPNVDFIDSCEDFLWEVETEGKQKFVSVSDRYLNAIGQHTEVAASKPMRNGPVMGFAKRIALIGAAFAVLICLTQGAIHFRWFTQNSSNDEQQYIIQGHSVNIDLIANSIAEHDQFATLMTDDWEEFTHFLGYSPTIIDPTAIGASNVQYTAFVEPGCMTISVRYATYEGFPVVYTIYHFIDAEEAYMLFEQDANGEQLCVNNSTVYCTENVDRHSFVWLNNSTLHILSGSLEKENFIEIISELTGGILHED